MLRLCIVSSPPRQLTNPEQPAQPTATSLGHPAAAAAACSLALPCWRVGCELQRGRSSEEGQKALVLPAAFPTAPPKAPCFGASLAALERG